VRRARSAPEAGARAARRLDPQRLGIPPCTVADLAGGDAATNAAILRDAFGGARSAVADALNLNAGVALAAAELAPSAEDGVALAQARRPSRPGARSASAQARARRRGCLLLLLTRRCGAWLRAPPHQDGRLPPWLHMLPRRTTWRRVRCVLVVECACRAAALGLG